jgi:hypothetical protein
MSMSNNENIQTICTVKCNEIRLIYSVRNGSEINHVVNYNTYNRDDNIQKSFDTLHSLDVTSRS